MPLVHPAKQVYKTHNRVRWVDSHIDHAMRAQLARRRVPQVVDDAVSYALVPMVETGALVLRVQFWSPNGSVGSILRNLPSLTSDDIWKLVDQTLDVLLAPDDPDDEETIP